MAPTVLPPGFRFHPTDEELVDFYLKRKVHALTIELDFIPEVDICKCEPWDLPEKSFLPGKDLEWYFFSPIDRKYPNGLRTNRATLAGYWKATGKDRSITCHKSVVGTKKTLVFYRGRAPHGCRTGWVMHEYRLQENECQSSPCLQDAYAVCRVFKKSGPGLANAEHVPQIDSPLSEGNLYNNNNMVSGTMQELSPLTQESDCQTTSSGIPFENYSGVINDISKGHPSVNDRWSHSDAHVSQFLHNSTSHPSVERTLKSPAFQQGGSFSAHGLEDFVTGLALTNIFEQPNSSTEDGDIVGQTFRDMQVFQKNNNEIKQFIHQEEFPILNGNYLQHDDLVWRSFKNEKINPKTPHEGQEEWEAFAMSNEDLDSCFFSDSSS